MALINCPECGKEVSDTSEKCPSCGYSIKNYLVQQKQIERRENRKSPKVRKKRVTILFVCFAAIIAVVIGFFVFRSYKEKQTQIKECENLLSRIGDFDVDVKCSDSYAHVDCYGIYRYEDAVNAYNNLPDNLKTKVSNADNIKKYKPNYEQALKDYAQGEKEVKLINEAVKGARESIKYSLYSKNTYSETKIYIMSHMWNDDKEIVDSIEDAKYYLGSINIDFEAENAFGATIGDSITFHFAGDLDGNLLFVTASPYYASQLP